MSERKTAEIKLRVTPSFKASLQGYAAGVQESMSEYIEKAVEQRARFSGPALASSIAGIFHPEIVDIAPVLGEGVETLIIPIEDEVHPTPPEPKYPWMFVGSNG